MTAPSGSFVLENVPQIDYLTHPDIFAEALGIALCYGDGRALERHALLRAYRLRPDHHDGVYGAISAVTGRGWMIGFDEAAVAGEGAEDSLPSFAVAGLASHLEHHETLCQAIRCLDRVPESLWHDGCECKVDGHAASGFIGASSRVNTVTLRRYVTNYLATHRQPLLALLHLPGVPIVEAALLTGYEGGGDAVLGRSPYLEAASDGTGLDGYFRLPDWERRTVAVVGIAEEKSAEWPHPLGYVAMSQALRYGLGCHQGTKHYGLATYDAWERALLDDAAIDSLNDDMLSRRLQHHSVVAGFIACQKAFCVMPEFEAPSMGVVSGFARRGAAGQLLIHGLMWDAWQVVGGYWRGAKPAGGKPGLVWQGTEDLRRFRDRRVRERAAAVVRRAREVDAQALEDFATAKREWDTCRGRGGDFACPCWGSPCVRAR